jgi:hypothetical protein
VLASFALRTWLGRAMVAPFIMVDELIYSELARSLVGDGTFTVRGAPASGYSLLYPLLIAPAYALFDALPEAYGAVKTVNALAMSLAAIPAYLIARRVARPPLALFAALLAVAVPSMAYTGTVMTENLYYPVFLLAALGLLRVLDQPGWGRIAALLGLLGVAYAVRSQSVALVPAVLTAPLLLVWFERSGVAGLRRYARLYGVILAAAAVVVGVQLARGQGLTELLGAYSVVGDRSYDAGSVLRFWAWHLEELTLYVAVIPVAAFLVLLGLAWTLPRALQVHVAATSAVLAWMSLAVAAFASQFAHRIQERNLFVVVPLLFAALVAWVERGAPRPRRVAVPAVAVAVALPILVPYERFIETGVISDTLALVPWWGVNTHLLGGSYAATVAVGVVAVGLLVLLIPARYAIALPLLVVVAFAFAGRSVWSGPHGFVQASEGALFQGIRGVPRDWIDRAVPDGAEVGVLWTGRPDRFSVNLNEFFNRRVGRVFYTDQPTPGGINETPVALQEKGRFPVPPGFFYLPNDAAVDLPYMLLDGTVTPAGTRVALDQTPLGGMSLWRLREPLQQTVDVQGLYPADTWSMGRVVWTQRPCRGGALSVRLSSDPSLHRAPVRVAARTDGVVRTVSVAPAGTAHLRIPLAPRRGTCVVRFTVSPTANPSEVIPGSTDDRELGLHFDELRVDRR